MRFAILGPLEARTADGMPLAIPRPRLRSLLAVLLMNANKTLSTERIVQLLWECDAPQGSAHAVHSYVSALRQLVAPACRLLNMRPGYRLDIKPGELDVDEFRTLSATGWQFFHENDFEQAVSALERACAMWRDTSFPDFPPTPHMQGLARQLVEELHSTEDLLVDVLLAVDRCREVIPVLTARTTEHPGHEPAWGQLMIALYRSERRAQALNTFTAARRALLEVSGIEPGTTLRRIQQQILHDDPALMACPQYSIS